MLLEWEGLERGVIGVGGSGVLSENGSFRMIGTVSWSVTGGDCYWSTGGDENAVWFCETAEEPARVIGNNSGTVIREA